MHGQKNIKFIHRIFLSTAGTTGAPHLCVFNTRLIFTQSRRFVLITFQQTRIMSRSYDCIKIFFNGRKTELRMWEASKQSPTLAASLQLSCLAFSRFLSITGNLHAVWAIPLSSLLSLSTILNYKLTGIFQKSLTFSRFTNVFVNSIRTQETVCKHFKFSGGADKNLV
jgi:hypothetical protein